MSSESESINEHQMIPPGDPYAKGQKPSLVSPKLELSMVMAPQTEQELIAGISQEALEDNEYVQDHPEYILEQRDFALRHPGEVPIVFFLGPSSVAKTTQSSNWGRADEMDKPYKAKLQRSPNGKVKPNYVFTVSTGGLLTAAAHEAGFKKKADVVMDEEFRVRGTQIGIDAVTKVRELFTNNPNYNASIFVDIVGLTEMDLGTSMVRALAKDPMVRFMVPELNAQIEAEGLGLRTEVAANPDQVDSIFSRHLVNPGVPLNGRAEDYVESCGDMGAWVRHWKDIFEQMQRLNPDMALVPLERFLQSFSFRKQAYDEWVPLRLSELGVAAEEKGKVTRTKNEYIPNMETGRKLHTHFDRMSIYRVAGGGNKKRHLPLHLFTGDNNNSDSLTPERILQELGEQVKRKSLYTE